MILEKQQIQRYMRHIIMPEIGGIGQKKLLSSSVAIYCDSFSNSALMLYYLAAMGIGTIHCYGQNTNEIKQITENISRLNPEVKMDFADISCKAPSPFMTDSDVIILCFEKADAKINMQYDGIPVILTASIGNLGYLKTAKDMNALASSLNEIKNLYLNASLTGYSSSLGRASAGLSGVLASIEAVKVLLEIDHPCENALQFDLTANHFAYGEEITTNLMDNSSSEEISSILKKSSALIVGSGGLGSPSAYMLAVMGIGKIGLVDYDVVEISNLNRQILHSTDKIGMPKVKSAEEFLKRLNPDIEINAYQEKFSLENAKELIENYDIIIDGLDNLPTRYLLNDVCYFLKKPLVEAGVLGFHGLATVLLPDIGPCYRCIFPETIAAEGAVPSCSETGVLGAVPGVLGILEAIEAVKQLTGIGSGLLNKILLFDALNLDVTILDVYKEPDCPLCGSKPTIHSLQKYEFICNTKRLP